MQLYQNSKMCPHASLLKPEGRTSSSHFPKQKVILFADSGSLNQEVKFYLSSLKSTSDFIFSFHLDLHYLLFGLQRAMWIILDHFSRVILALSHLLYWEVTSLVCLPEKLHSSPHLSIISFSIVQVTCSPSYSKNTEKKIQK